MKKRFISIVFLLVLMLLPTVIFATESEEVTIQTLQQQIDNAESGATITLTEDVVLTERLLIPEGKTIILDLAGKTLTLPAVDGNYGMTIKGDLTITGNGTVNCNGLYGIGVSTTAGSKLTIKNGTFNHPNGDYLIGSFGTTIIEGGTFNAGYCVANAFTGYASSVEAKAGTFTATAADALVVLGNTTVTGGTYNQDVKAYTPDGLTTNSSNGLYSIVNKIGHPEYEVIGGKKCFFANGTPITITEAAGGALISWTGGSMTVESDTSVFGGMHDDSTPVNSSIVMNSGEVKNLIGGGLHKSNTLTSKIVMNGGKVVAIQGGGAAAFVTTCDSTIHPDCAASYKPSAEVTADATKSICQTGTANVTVTGNSVVSSTIYGGGQGISNTNKATVNISGNVDVSSGWVTAGGANGNTTEATLNIEGGNLKYVQSVNRGSMNEAEVSVTGGTIEELYVAGIPTSTTGTIQKVTLEVGEDATVNLLLNGTSSGTTPIAAEKTTVLVNSNATIGSVEDIVKNNATTTYTVTIDGKKYDVAEGGKVTDILNYGQITSMADHNFIGFKQNGNMFDENTPITSNISLTTTFERIGGVAAAPVVGGEKDDTPKTGAQNINAYAAILATIALIGIVVIKKS